MSRSLGSILRALVTTIVVVTVLLSGRPAVADDVVVDPPESAATGRGPVEDYASYQAATRCAPKAKPGTVFLGRWLVRRYGGHFGSISRHCSRGSRSEHTEGRAFDWSLDVRSSRDRRVVKAFLTDAFATDSGGNADAMARRMGIMYVIWKDRMFAAWNQFRPEPYLASSCRTKKKCSRTLQHRDHVHISLTRRAARGLTSWFYGKLEVVSR